jgi:hypothetical protein
MGDKNTKLIERNDVLVSPANLRPVINAINSSSPVPGSFTRTLKGIP